MNRAAGSALLAGLLPIVVVNLAFWLNVQHGLAGCFPYVEGCWSVSRGVRDGPGLWFFKAAALPTAVFMALTWRWLPGELSGPWTRRLGTIGALCLLVYAFALGTDGEFYKWMRRYGVVFYFGLTGIAQLMVANRLWRLGRPMARFRPRASTVVYLTLAAFTWGVGLVSAFKRQLFDDPSVIDRVQNAMEWNFALGLALLFLGLAGVLVAPGARGMR